MAVILVIDDSAYARSKVRDFLKLDGHEVREAGDGAKGLKAVHDNPPDCIILDLIMPELDGFKILNVLHERTPKIPVVVCTADIQESVRKQCIGLGAAAFIHKPPREAELRETVRTVLESGKR